MQRIRNSIEYVLIFVTAGISIMIAIIDLAGLLDANLWITQRIPTLTLLGVGFIASYLILERRGKLDEISMLIQRQGIEILGGMSASVSDIVRALHGVEVAVYQVNEGAKFISDFLKRAHTAKRVDDITWGEDVPPISGQESNVYGKYYDTVTEVASKPKVVWREIAIFIKRSRFERIKPLLTANIPGYNVKYYDAVSEMPPRLTFAIIDNEEVFLASYDLRLVIRHADIVAYFVRYYENLWARGKVLKIGNKTNRDEIDKLSSLLE